MSNQHLAHLAVQTSPQTSRKTSSRTFPLFSSLLPELRLEIWSRCLPPPRILHVYPESSTPPTSESELDSSDSPMTYTSSPISPSPGSTSESPSDLNPPAILSVNRESREEALRHLTVRFGTYWNFEKDVLYLESRRKGTDEGTEFLRDMTERGLLEGVKHVMVECDIWRRGREREWGGYYIRTPPLISLPSTLAQITYVIDPRRGDISSPPSPSSPFLYYPINPSLLNPSILSQRDHDFSLPISQQDFNQKREAYERYWRGVHGREDGDVEMGGMGSETGGTEDGGGVRVEGRKLEIMILGGEEGKVERMGVEGRFFQPPILEQRKGLAR